jgi:hypothetical protein
MQMLHELFEATMLQTLSEIIVYVNVTRNIRSRHVDNIERDNCLCECYTSYSKPPCWKY